IKGDIRVQTTIQKLAFPAKLLILANNWIQDLAITILRGLRLENIRVTGIDGLLRRQVINQANIRRDLVTLTHAIGLQELVSWAGVIVVVVIAGNPRTHNQMRPFKRIETHRGISTCLARLHIKNLSYLPRIRRTFQLVIPGIEIDFGN